MAKSILICSRCEKVLSLGPKTRMGGTWLPHTGCEICDVETHLWEHETAIHIREWRNRFEAAHFRPSKEDMAILTESGLDINNRKDCLNAILAAPEAFVKQFGLDRIVKLVAWLASPTHSANAMARSI